MRQHSADDVILADDVIRFDGVTKIYQAGTPAALARFRARHVGIIFQFFNLLDDLTVADNVLLPAQLAGSSRHAAGARAAELLERLGIADHRDDYRRGCPAASGSGSRSPGRW